MAFRVFIFQLLFVGWMAAAAGPGQIKLLESSTNGSNFTALKAATSISTDVTYILPPADGSSGQFLSTNGAGALAWGSASSWSTVSKSSNYSVLTSDREKMFLVTGNTTLTLPSPSGAGSGFRVAFNNAGTNTVTVQKNASETINGASLVTLGPTESMILITDGTNWFYFSKKSMTANGCTPTMSEDIDGADNAYGQSIWQQGSYVYFTQDASPSTLYADNVSTGVRAGTYTFAAGRNPTGSAMWGDGTYIYVGTGNYLYAFSFNGTTFTPVILNTATPVNDIWGDGTYIYVAAGTTGIKAFTFNGTTLAQAGSTYNTPGTANRIFARTGGQVFSVDDGSNLLALTFNGTSFTLRSTHTGASGSQGGFSHVTGDSSYIYATYMWDMSVTEGSEVLTFNGTSITNTGVKTARANAVSPGYVYSLPDVGIVRSFAFNGTTTTFNMVYEAPGAWTADMNTGSDSRVYIQGSFGGVKRFAVCSP